MEDLSYYNTAKANQSPFIQRNQATVELVKKSFLTQLIGSVHDIR